MAAKECSFDIVSKVDLQELKNAVDQAVREVDSRYDFKNAVATIELEGELLKLHAEDEMRLKSLIEILQGRLVKRGISLKALDYGKMEPATRATVRQEIKLKQGLDTDTGRKVSKLVRDSGRKVSCQIQGDQVRVTGKSRDDLQAVIELLKAADLSVDLQFVNYR